MLGPNGHIAFPITPLPGPPGLGRHGHRWFRTLLPDLRGTVKGNAIAVDGFCIVGRHIAREVGAKTIVTMIHLSLKTRGAPEIAL